MPPPAMVLMLQHMCVKPTSSCVGSALHVMLLLPPLSGGLLRGVVVVDGAVEVAVIDGELWSMVSVVRITLCCLSGAGGTMLLFCAELTGGGALTSSLPVVGEVFHPAPVEPLELAFVV